MDGFEERNILNEVSICCLEPRNLIAFPARVHLESIGSLLGKFLCVGSLLRKSFDS